MLRLKRAYALIFLFVSLETTVAAALPAPALFPHLSVLVVLFGAMEEGASSGAKCGFWLGILLDLLSINRFGTFCLIYTCLGAICGILKGKVFQDAYLLQILSTLGAYLAILFALFYLSQARDDSSAFVSFMRLMWRSSLIPTVVVSPFVFAFCRKMLRQKRTAQQPHLYIQ